MSDPLNISRAICLTVATELDVPGIKCWRQCVYERAPAGTAMSLSTIDDKGVPQTVAVVHREGGGKHRYLIPLTRDLTEDEGERIVHAFGELQPDMDFDISVSATAPDVHKAAGDEVDLDQERYMALCTAWAKRQHEQWVKDRTENGWTYGIEVSLKNKTHPLLRPWTELPDNQKTINLNDPQMLLDLLNEQGYMVISKTELEAVLKLIRGV